LVDNTLGWNKNDTSSKSIMEKKCKGFWLVLDMMNKNGCQREMGGNS